MLEIETYFMTCYTEYTKYINRFLSPHLLPLISDLSTAPPYPLHELQNRSSAHHHNNQAKQNISLSKHTGRESAIRLPSRNHQHVDHVTILMRDILKHRTNFPLTTLLPQQQILNRLQALIDEMVPSARIAIQHRRRLHKLLPIRLTPLTLERIVRIAGRLGMVLEQLSQTVERKVPLDVFCGVDDAR